MITTINDNVIVKVIEEDKKDEGMLVPDTHRKMKFGMGEVVAIEDNLPVKVGDLVYFDTLLLTSVKIKQEDLKFIKFSDILGYDRR